MWNQFFFLKLVYVISLKELILDFLFIATLLFVSGTRIYYFNRCRLSSFLEIDDYFSEFSVFPFLRLPKGVSSCRVVCISIYFTACRRLQQAWQYGHVI